MQVILCGDVIKLGKSGELCRVSPGFARNYLFPRKLAISATPSNLKQLESLKTNLQLKADKTLLEAKGQASEIELISLEIPWASGREGHLFGSITALTIAKALGEKGFSVDKRDVVLDSPIKSAGDFVVTIQLHPQVSTQVKLKVSPKS